MHLVLCAPPTEPLEKAPRTSLRPDSEGGTWHGFWSLTTERYYARRTRDTGLTEWYQVVEPEDAAAGVAPLAGAPAPAVLATAPAERRRVMLLLARSANARGILVGNARPKAR
ncbi:MAG TPA: hypothetical protein VJU87_07895 [Gemmatimonadaceae bacterium]|nr:hypothetical protein [Gemmatimonadaceae bacterium]